LLSFGASRGLDMSEQVKKTVVKERAENPDFAIAPLPPRGDLPARTDVEKYLEAKEGVAAKDRADFEEYLNQKSQLQNWVGAVNYWVLRADF
jgi:hypothetical protein